MKISNRTFTSAVTIALAVFVFQNCGQAFEGASYTGAAQLSVLPAPNPLPAPGPSPLPGPGPGPGPGPQPGPTPQPFNIPSSAISNLAIATGSVCPAGFYHRPFGWSAAPLCVERYAGSSRTQVVTDVRSISVVGLCPSNYVSLGVAPNGNSTMRICAAYSLPAEARAAVTDIYSGQPNCLPGDDSVSAATLQWTLCISRRTGNLPTRAVTAFETTPWNLFMSGEAQRFIDVSPGDAQGVAAAVGDVGAKMSAFSSGNFYLSDVRVVAHAEACPAGFSLAVDLVNKDLPAISEKLCAQTANGITNRVITGVYVSRVFAGSQYVPAPCLPGDTIASTMTLYLGGPGTDYVAGRGNLCVSE